MTSDRRAILNRMRAPVGWAVPFFQTACNKRPLQELRSSVQMMNAGTAGRRGTPSSANPVVLASDAGCHSRNRMDAGRRSWVQSLWFPNSSEVDWAGWQVHLAHGIGHQGIREFGLGNTKMQRAVAKAITRVDLTR